MLQDSNPPSTPITKPDSQTPTPPKSIKPRVRKFKFKQSIGFQVIVVFGVAFFLATLFTAWIPGQYQDNRFLSDTSVAPRPDSSITQLNTPIPPQAVSNVVGIVAGHWKNDPGAVCPDGLREVDVNLNIATLVQKLLEGQGYEVELLKEFDTRLLNYRAAALVSIHNDSCNFVNNEATGFKVSSAMGDRHPENSARLTACLRGRYAQITGRPLHSTSLTPDMTSYHAFNEIDENTPAAIIETGFLNLDREFLTQSPEIASKGIVAGILCFLNNEEIIQPTNATVGSPEIQTPSQPLIP